MKLLFLDIDGVLNSKRTEVIFGDDLNVHTLDPVAVDLVRDVVHSTDCVICLISEWRRHHNFMQLGKELDLPILFETTHDKLETRGDEIQLFIDNVKPNIYAILDDITQERQRPLESQKENFVKVDGDNGFGYENYLDLIGLLK
jgi:hypothetical protein